MSFKDTILPDFVIADLYADSITANIDRGAIPKSADEIAVPFTTEAVIPGMEKGLEGIKAAVTPKTDLYRFLGKNQKKVSVIARYKDDPYIPEEHLQFLIKILSACKLNLGDVAILNDAAGGIGIAKLKEQLDPGFVLLFAVEPVEIGLPLSFPLLRPQLFDGCNFLTIPRIETLIQDTDTAKGLKKQLWDCLKKMFGV
ncbi:hypothetical protein [Flavitalea sp.]|nr:hypothetical protein [Flavitalea sp.]